MCGVCLEFRLPDLAGGYRQRDEGISGSNIPLLSSSTSVLYRQIPHPLSRPREHCRYWVQGRGCKRGDRCRSWHDLQLRELNFCHIFLRNDCEHVLCNRIHPAPASTYVLTTSSGPPIASSNSNHITALHRAIPKLVAETALAHPYHSNRLRHWAECSMNCPCCRAANWEDWWRGGCHICIDGWHLAAVSRAWARTMLGSPPPLPARFALDGFAYT